MAAAVVMSNIQTKNKLVQYTTEINREFVRENLFSPYMGTDATSIIRLRNEAKKGGDQINFPLVGALYGPGTAPTLGSPTQAFGVDTLTGFEEKIDNYGMRVWIDWARNAVATNDAEEQKDSADIFGEAKPLLSDWGKSLQRDEIILAMMALPSESQPTNLGGLTTLNGRVNGLPFLFTTAPANILTWIGDNVDRVLVGNAISNLFSAGTTLETSLATMLGKVDTAGDTFVPASLSLMKYRAKTAVPKIRPYVTRDGREYFVAFAGSANFGQLKLAMNQTGMPTTPAVIGINVHARSREGDELYGAPNNPLFQDGDLLYDGVIVREVPEIDNFVATWELSAAGASSSRVAPVFLCGQQAVMFAWGKMATPTFRDQTDYQFVRGVGVKLCYGVAKTFRIPRRNFDTVDTTYTKKVQTGMVTGLFSAATPV